MFRSAPRVSSLCARLLTNRCFIVAAGAMGGLASTANAAVYEPFNYNLANNTSIGGATPTGTGENTSATWAVGTSGFTATYLTTGLTLSGSTLATSAGSLDVKSGTTANNQANAVVPLTAAFGQSDGTFYTSFLSDLVSVSTSQQEFDSQIINSGTIGAPPTNAGGGGVDYNSSDIYFNNRAGGVGVGGGRSGFAANPSNPGFTQPSTGVTYFYVTQFNRSGAALTGKSWILDGTGYNNLVAQGVSTSNLNLYSLAFTGTANGTAANTGATSFLGLAAYPGFNNEGTGTEAIYDEIRYGTSLSDVVPAPEPTAFALIGFGSLCLLGRRHRKF